MILSRIQNQNSGSRFFLKYISFHSCKTIFQNKEKNISKSDLHFHDLLYGWIYEWFALWRYFLWSESIFLSEFHFRNISAVSSNSAADDDHGDRSGLSLWKRLDWYSSLNSISPSLPPSHRPSSVCNAHSYFTFHFTLSRILGFMKRIYTIHLHEYIYLFSHIQTECLQTVTILHPSLFLVIIQGFVAYIYHILYFSML